MSSFPHRLPNRVVREANLAVADKLFLLHGLTWRRRYRDDSGKEQKSSQEFVGWNSHLAIRNLGISRQRPYRKILATLDFLKIHKVQYRGRDHLQISLFNSISEMTYFYCPQEVFDLELTPSEKLGLIVAFMLRDQSSYQLRSKSSFIDELGRCLHLTSRQSQRVKRTLVEQEFLRETPIAGKASTFEMLPHPSFSMGWESLVKSEPVPKASSIPSLHLIKTA